MFHCHHPYNKKLVDIAMVGSHHDDWMAADKYTTTVRFSERAGHQLKRLAVVLRKSQSQILEEAFSEYCKNHDLTGRFVLSVTPKHQVLLQQDDGGFKVLDVQDRNGMAPEEARQRYAIKLHSPVDLVIQEGEAL